VDAKKYRVWGVLENAMQKYTGILEQRYQAFILPFYSPLSFTFCGLPFLPPRWCYLLWLWLDWFGAFSACCMLLIVRVFRELCLL
jgi:hypothetical protein